MLRLDHVGYAVRDLDEAAVRFREEFGLDSVEGGRHVGLGTANRIVPLGPQYIELIAVVDRAEAEANAFGRSVIERTAEGGGWLLTVAASDDVEAEAERLGLQVRDGTRVRPDGQQVRWRMAGMDDPRREPWMPFFITWDIPMDLHPGRSRAGHGVRADGIAWVEVGGDKGRLREWLGDADLPIRVTDAEEGIHRVGISTSDGELVID
ncbi:MAG TPA: VOC family protein [Actinomycetota bacterium]|nr:VOC family protein [Actinomycetota bacterium]